MDDSNSTLPDTALGGTPVLVEWSIWFLVMGLSVGLVMAALFSGHGFLGTDASTLMYAAIFSLALFTLQRNFRDALLIDNETKLATKQVNQMEELDDIELFLKKATPSIFRRHIASLYRIFKNDNEIRQENLIALLQEKMLARNRVTELLSNILVTLGLIGTVVGLILMMTNMQMDLAGFDPNDPEQNIIQDLMREGGALAGLDTAFYTTLFGSLLGGVFLKVLTNFVEASILRYTAHVAELTEVNVLPQMRSIARELEKTGYYARQHQL